MQQQIQAPLDDAEQQRLQQQNQPFSIETFYKDSQLLVRLQPQQGVKETSIDICCVVDTSGSMDSAAANKNDAEKDGLSILDVVKHAVKTVISNLGPGDRMSLVTFGNQAQVIFEMTHMNENGKKMAVEKTEGLYTSGCTNLWDGLYNGMETIRKSKQKNSNAAVLLFTDGCPNVDPPRGYPETLKKYLDQSPLNCVVNTFGFGYNLNSELLDFIGKETNGSYGFIPDSGFVGTIFVNALTNLKCIQATQLSVSVETLNGAQIVTTDYLQPIYNVQTAQWGAKYQLGNLLFDQSRDILINLNLTQVPQDKPFAFVKATCIPQQTIKKQPKLTEQSVEVAFNECSEQESLLIQSQILRNMLITSVRQTFKLDEVQAKKQQIDKLKTYFEKNIAFKENYVSDLYKDITGQITEGLINQQYFNKWGKHFIPSLISAHVLQQQNNFKDPGVQHYGGKLFETFRDKSEKVFISLPPPKPSIKVQTYDQQTGKTTYQAPKQKKNMQSYISRSAPCFAEGSTVYMYDGTQKNVKCIQKGDKIMAKNKRDFQIVECVIKTVCNTIELVQLDNNLKITPYHPVLHQNTWKFPIDINESIEQECPAVYSFLLKDRDQNKGNTITINNIDCATLAHHLNDNDVISHEFFGTEKIVSNLKTLKGWEQGFVILQKGCLVKSEITDLVQELSQITV